MAPGAETSLDATGAPLVEMRAVGKRFSGNWALRDLELRVHPGESVAIVGPNGSGKSTLLRLVATLWKPTSGEVKLFGYEAEDIPSAFRQRLGYLGHASLLYPQLTLRENLLFYARLYNVPLPETRLQELTRQLGLTGWGERRVEELSRGLEQRAALARALVHSPALLLLDEPFSGLDPEASECVLEILQALRRVHVTILLCTHDFAYAEQLCTRVLCLCGGRMLYDGPMTRPLQAAYARWLQG